MKKLLPLAAFILTAGFPCLVLVDLVGVSVPAVFNGETYIALVAATGLLATAAGDTSARHAVKTPAAAKPARRTAEVAHPAPSHAADTWGYHTMSA